MSTTDHDPHVTAEERNATRTDLLRELASETCCCGKDKRKRNTFCASCYYSLPQYLKREIHKLVGEGYEEGYAAAREFLEREAWPKRALRTKPDDRQGALL